MDNYKLIKKLSKGSYGNIYLINDKFNHKYVLKKIDIIDKDSEIKMNKSEILIGFFNKCPFLINYYDIFTTTSNLYLIMKYCPQGTLKDYLKNNLSIEKKNNLVSNIISGIQYLHNNKVIHRDLKSDNILIYNDTPLISDFGTCCILNEFEYFGKTSIGTPYYLSPEIASGINHTYKADIYSLGCILCEVYKNKLPYSGVNIGNLFYNVSKSKMDIILSNNNIDYLIKKMLNNDPSKRPSINQIISYFDTKISDTETKCFRKDKSFMDNLKKYNLLNESITTVIQKIIKTKIKLPQV